MSERDTLFRQWEMLRLIPRYPRKTTARDIQEVLANSDFDITKRTIERDLQTLSEIFPLLCDERAKPFGWSWQQDAPSFDLPGLSSTEALTMKLVEQYLRPLLPTSIMDQLKPHFRSAEERLSKLPGHGKIGAWANKVRIVPPTQPLIAPSIKPEVQGAVYEALLHGRQIEVAYLRRGDSRPIGYKLHPLGIVQRGALTYLVATVSDYHDARLFALHRFQKIDMLDAPIGRPPGFDLDRYIASGALGFGNGKTIKLKSIFTRDAAEHLYETPLSSDQVLTLLDQDYIKLVASVADTPQLTWWLLGFGDQVEVISPTALRSRMVATVLEMGRKYQTP